MIMERIVSFQADLRRIGIGMYISRIDGDIVTYDISGTYELPYRILSAHPWHEP